MDNNQKLINSNSRPVPSKPGPQQITTEGQMAKKGGADFTQPIPKENLIPGSSKSSSK